MSDQIGDILRDTQAAWIREKSRADNLAAVLKNVCEDWQEEKCEPSCDSLAHDEKCCAINIALSYRRMKASIEKDRKLGVHLSHCNFGEEAGYCKYGDEDCPALSEGWKWMGDAITKSENKDKTIARLRQRIIELEEELSSANAY